MEAPLLSPAALATLEHYSFPGNVRELENILERAFTLCEHQRIEPRDLRLSAEPTPINPGNPQPRHTPAPHDSLPSEADILAAGNLEKYLEDIERAVLERTLLAARWNKSLAAQRLGLSFRQIRYKLKNSASSNGCTEQPYAVRGESEPAPDRTDLTHPDGHSAW